MSQSPFTMKHSLPYLIPETSCPPIPSQDATSASENQIFLGQRVLIHRIRFNCTPILAELDHTDIMSIAVALHKGRTSPDSHPHAT